jgi:hypothetical protein
MSDDYRDDPWVEAIASLPLVTPEASRATKVWRRSRAALEARSGRKTPKREASGQEPDVRIVYSFGGSAPIKYFTK